MTSDSELTEHGLAMTSNSEDASTAAPVKVEPALQPKPLVGPKARFFDSRQLDQGCAGHVVHRAPSLGGLTVLQISDVEPSLASFLVSLDNKAIRVECVADGPTFRFKWASAYSDGKMMRIQGVLEEQ